MHWNKADKVMIPALVLGVGLQVWHFLEIQSLWLDETYVAAEITMKSFQDILSMFSIFAAQPRTPVLFQAVVKLSALVIPGEAGLRLFPFLCAVFSVPLFYIFCKKISDPPTALLSL